MATKKQKAFRKATMQKIQRAEVKFLKDIAALKDSPSLKGDWF